MTIIVRERVPGLSLSALFLSSGGSLRPQAARFLVAEFVCTQALPEFFIVIDWLDGWISMVVS